MRYLVLGASGMAGHLVSLYLKESGAEVIGASRHGFEGIEHVSFDACDLDSATALIEGTEPDCIVNLIGVLNSEAEEDKPRAVLLNSALPHVIANSALRIHAKLIHISTDCVFKGDRGSYTEFSTPDAVSFYGRSKALGELVDSEGLTIRTSIIGPDMNPKGIGLFNWFMKQNGLIYGYSNVSWTGLTTLELAKLIESVSHTNLQGLYNVVPGKAMSKFELLRLFSRYFPKSEIQIVEDANKVEDKSLVSKKNLNYLIPSYEAMVKEMGQWIRLHRKLYPHYDGTRLCS